MMKFLLNVVAITCRINNVSLYIHDKLLYVQAVLYTFVLIVYIYIYIYRVKSFSESIMLHRSAVDDHVSLVSPSDSSPPINIYTHYKVSQLACIYQNFLL